MEDPWANAWGEPSKQPSSSSWSAPSISTIHGDREDDISTRSWSVEPTSRWDEPDLTEASLWRNEPSSTWQPAHSTFDTIPLSTVSLPLPSEEHEQSEIPPSDDSPSPGSPTSETPSLSPSSSPKPLHLSRTATPDAFGTFTGADESWKPTFSLPSVEADAWGPSWGESNESKSVEPPGTAEALDNAWETAKQQKAKQDSHVPPELLASILRQLEEMSGEFWPDTDASNSATENEGSLEVEIIVPASIAQRFMPDDLTLPSNVQFTKTFISKELTEALKLTKHVPQTRFSPMAMYMLSKGSTSWETAIKSQPNTTDDDFVPAGWKIVEAAKESTVVDEGKKKTGSGLLSFFGRKSSSSQSESRSASPPVNSPVISSLKAGSSPRTSTDNSRSTPAIGSRQGSGRTTPIANSSSSISTQKNDLNPASSVALDPVVREPTPPPSAVSRFLGRFSSRAKPRDSLALSQDDLEFLSDVPTFSESESTHESDLDALSMMIKSPPLPTTLPPPLPPPPPPRTLSQATKLEQDPMNDDPFSIFSSSDSASTASTPPVRSPLLNSSLSPTALPFVSDSGNINNQGWSSFGDLPEPVNGILPTKHIPLVPKPRPNAAPALSQGSSSQKQRRGRDFGSTGVISPLPPPPGSRTPSHTPLSPPAINFYDDDDDFSEFLSSPAKSPPPVRLSFTHNTLVPNPPSSIGQAPNSSLDGFDEFVMTFSSDPQPPRPPAKQPQLAPNSPSPNNRRTPSTQTPTHSRTVSKADHSRTLSLLENVAARGRWLGPASPLPEALPPPTTRNMKSSNDYFSHGSTMQTQQAQAVAALSASFQAPTLTPDEKNRSQNGSCQLTPAYLLPSLVSSQPPLSKLPKLHSSSMNPAPAEVKSGGLSAQDLSFFEGL